MWLKLYCDYITKHCKKYWQNQNLKLQAMNIMIEQTSSLVMNINAFQIYMGRTYGEMCFVNDFVDVIP
jgi:hypothetical protein